MLFRSAALFTNGDAAEQGDRVKLMTVHAAKGLEFPHVFLCGMNEGVFPSRRTRTQDAMEEERRLAFVAMTRAEQGLYLSEAEGRNLDGSPRYPSRFLLDIDPDCLTLTHPPRAGLVEEARRAIENSLRWMPESESAVLPAGQRVRHAVFGPGTVTGADLDRSAYIVQFDGINTPRKISFRARLERL